MRKKIDLDQRWWAGVLSLVVLMSGCGKQESPTEPPSSAGPNVVNTAAVSGSTFLASGQKLRCVVEDNSVTPSREVVFELYVDGDGDGEGLMGVGDFIQKVAISGNILFVYVDDNIIVPLTDVSGRGYLTTLSLSNESDVTKVGFSCDSGVVTKYSGKTELMVLNTQYSPSTKDYPRSNFSTDGGKTLVEFVNYLIDYYTERVTDGDEVEQGEDSKTEVKSFYTESPYGVTIGGKVYSLGDTCNPNDYFGTTPEGLLESSAYREDTRVDFLHVSYISETGRTVFVTTGNYVQRIETDADFSWLIFKKGEDLKSVKQKLGIGLRKADMASFKPIDENLVYIKTGGKTIYCQVNQVNVELRFENDMLNSIYLERQLSFNYQ